MKACTLLAACAAVALVMAGCDAAPETAETAAPAAPEPEPTELDVEDVAGRLAAGEDIFLLSPDSGAEPGMRVR